MTTLSPRPVASSPSRTIPAFYKLLLRGQLTKGRLVGLSGLIIVGFVISIVLRTGVEREGLEAITTYGAGLLMPLTALLLATPMIGNLVEDRLLVYLWLKPVPRWHLAVAAVAAVVTVMIPVVVVPMVLYALILGFGSMVLPAVLAGILGSIAYGALYVLFGARFSFGLWLGLAYLVLWEQVLARLTDGTGRLSIQSYVASILGWGTDVPVPLGDRSSVAAVVVPLLIGAVGTALVAMTLRSRDID